MMKKRLIPIIASVVMVIGAFSQNYKVEAGTSKVPSGYTPIYTIEDLYGINDNLDGNYILMNDIDLSETKPGGEWDSGNGWTPIGTIKKFESKSFNGILDGNGYRIENMTIYGEDQPSCVGLFADVNGTVKNLALTDIDISLATSSGYCGGIAAGVGNIESCYVSGKIDSKSASIVGGIGGDERGNGANVSNCYTDVDIINGNRAKLVGGIVGSNYNGHIENCYAIGDIETVEIESDYRYDERRVGAIVGQDYDTTGFSKNSYYLGNGNDEYAKKLTKAQMKSQKCFTGFDFENTWIVDKNSPYPYPQLRNCMQVRTESIELISEPEKLNYTTADKQLDLTGSELKINYEDNYDVTVPLDESMLSYNMKEGNQTVTVKYNNCKTSFEISVKEAKESLKVLAKKQTLKIGDTYTFKVKYVGQGKVQYTSSNSKILSIDKNTGKVKAKKAGKVTIIIKAGKIVKKVGLVVKK